MTSGRTTETLELDARIDANQRKIAAEIRPFYDFMVCGSGSSGSVVTRRLAETGDASVLLLEAGGTDDLPSVSEPAQWHTNLKTDLERIAGTNASRRGVLGLPPLGEPGPGPWGSVGASGSRPTGRGGVRGWPAPAESSVPTRVVGEA